MYLKNLDFNLRIRLSEELFLFLTDMADKCGISVSQYVRMLIESDYSLRGASREHK